MTWEEVKYHPVEINSSKIEGFLSSIRKTHVNGGVILACFEADNPIEFDHATFHDLRGADHPFHTFLTSPNVAKTLSDLEIDPPFDPKPEFRHTVALAMEGELTHSVLVGGAYERFRGEMEDARKISRDFMEEIVQGRWLELSVVVTYTPWTNWFYDVAWDCTFIVCDRAAHRFWLLCITDTD